MSWQTYIDQSLLGTGFVQKAAIFGLDGAQWATSSNLAVKGDEAKKLVGAFSDPSPLFAAGIHLAGTKFTFLRDDPGRSIYGRLGGDAGCCIVKSGKAMIIGIYEGGTSAGNCVNVCEKLADYLISVGY